MVDNNGQGILLDPDMALRSDARTIPRCEVGYYRSVSTSTLACRT